MEGHFSVSTGILTYQAPEAFKTEAEEVIPEYDRITAQDIFAVTCFTIGSGGLVLIPLFFYAVYSLFIKDEKKEAAELTNQVTQTYREVYGKVFKRLTELDTNNNLIGAQPDPVSAFIEVDGKVRQFRITPTTEDNKSVLIAGFVDGDQFKKDGTLLELFEQLSSQKLDDISRLVKSIKIYSGCIDESIEQVVSKSGVGERAVVDEQAHVPISIFLKGEMEVKSQPGVEVRRPYVFSAPAPALAASKSAYEPAMDIPKMMDELAENYPKGGRYLDASLDCEPTFNKKNFTADINAMMTHALKAVTEHVDIKRVVLAPFEESIYAHDLEKIDKGTEAVRYSVPSNLMDLDSLYSFMPDHDQSNFAKALYLKYKSEGSKVDESEQTFRELAKGILGSEPIEVKGSKAFQAEARSIVAAAYADLIISLRQADKEVVYSDNRLPNSELDKHLDFWEAVNSELRKKRAMDITPVQKGNSDIDQGWPQDTDMIFNFFDSRYLVGQQPESPRNSFNERLGKEMPLVTLAHKKYKENQSNLELEYSEDFSSADDSKESI